MAQYEIDLDEVKHLYKIYIWAAKVEIDGLPKTRRISGFHDEPLKGNRSGQRSVRLNKAYRLFYVEDSKRLIVTVKVIEVNKHEY